MDSSPIFRAAGFTQVSPPYGVPRTIRNRQQIPYFLEHFKVEMSYSGVAEDKAGKERKAGNPAGLSMQRDAASRRRRQHECDRSTLNCSKRRGRDSFQGAFGVAPALCGFAACVFSSRHHVFSLFYNGLRTTSHRLLNKTERAGFEPAVPEGTPVFETGPISRSGTSPVGCFFDRWRIVRRPPRAGKRRPAPGRAAGHFLKWLSPAGRTSSSSCRASCD